MTSLDTVSTVAIHLVGIIYWYGQLHWTWAMIACDLHGTCVPHRIWPWKW